MGTFANREWNPALGPRVNSRYYSTGSEPGRARNRLRKGLLYRPGSDLTDENERAGPTAIARVSFGGSAVARHGIARGRKSSWPRHERCFFLANEFEHWLGNHQTGLQRCWDIVARVERRGEDPSSRPRAASVALKERLLPSCRPAKTAVSNRRILESLTASERSR